MFNKKEEIFDNLCEKDVPISRAAWYIKVRPPFLKILGHILVPVFVIALYLSSLQMTAAYSSTMTDLKLNKKKQSTGPSFGMYVCVCAHRCMRCVCVCVRVTCE